MGIFDDVFDGVREMAEPFVEFASDTVALLAKPVAIVTAPVVAVTLGITAAMVETAVRAGAKTVADVKNYWDL